MKRLIRSLVLLVMAGASMALVCCGFVMWFVLQDLPSLDALRDYHPPQSTMVFDRNGDIIGKFYDERRTVVPVKTLNKLVPRAFVAAEDGDFYAHRGIDYVAVLRAVLLEIKHRTIGGRREGGSTITQQAARTMLLSSKQTYIRKLREMVLAKRIEEALTKDEILHLYLNQIYFGNGAYGIEEGARTYFQKPASELKLFEAAALACIPKSPNRINPFGDTERLKSRQHYVLDQMVRRGFISEKEAQSAKAMPLFSDASGRKKEQAAPYFLREIKKQLLPKMGDEFIRQGGVKVFSTLDLRLQKLAETSLSAGLKSIDKRAGYRGPLYRPDPQQNKIILKLLNKFRAAAFKKGSNKIWNLASLTEGSINKDLKGSIDNLKLGVPHEGIVVGARVESVSDRNGSAVIDLGSRKTKLALKDMSWARKYSNRSHKNPLPKKASQVLKRGDIILVKLHVLGEKIRASLEQEPTINGGLVALDVKTGGVLAMVGGYDYGSSQFNRITQAKRQSGSGIKPLIYGLAIDRESATPTTIISDVPKVFFDPGTDEFWRPRNSTRKFLGDITFRRCLRSSVNTCTITLLEKIGLGNFLTFAKDLNLNTEQTPFPKNLTIALGSAENHPIDLANAMRVFGNQGKFSNYYMIDMVKKKNGQQKEVFDFSEKTALKSESAFIVTNILKDVISPAQRAEYLNKVKCELAGKTGTTNKARSLWFFGYSPKILALVFVGYDDNRSIGKNEWGVTSAFPIWAQFMNGVPDHEEELTFLQPEEIEWRYVDKKSGSVIEVDEATEVPPDTVKEAFKLGSAPKPTQGRVGASTPLELFESGAFAP